MRNAKVMQRKAHVHAVEDLGLGQYRVTSGASGGVYLVSRNWTGAYMCSCPWGQYRPAGSPCACSHVLAVVDREAERQGRRVSAWATPEDAARQRRPMVNVGDGVFVTTRKGER